MDKLFGFVLNWVPLYGMAHLLFLSFCAYLRGATLIYSRYIKPYLAAHEESIDHGLGVGIDFVQSRTKGIMSKASAAGRKYIENNQDAIIGLTGNLPGEENGGVQHIPGEDA